MAAQFRLRGSLTASRAPTALQASRLPQLHGLGRQALHVQLRYGHTRSSASATTNLLSKATSSMTKSPVPWWVFGSAGLVATTLTVGAAAQLTRSGASMLYWKPRAWGPPRNDGEWQEEFVAYRDFCARHQRDPMTLEDFKRNYKWDFGHRLLGQATALFYAGPLVYLFAKDKIPIPAQGPLALVAALGLAQAYVGRGMVEDSLEPEDDEGGERSLPTGVHGATFQLPVHTAFSLANFALLVWTGLGLVSATSRAVKLRELVTLNVLKQIGEVRKYYQAVTGLLAVTMVGGSVVAKIDGGRDFQTFPKMDDRWIPQGLFEQKPWLRNLHDNVAMVQLEHRLLALGTLAAYGAVHLKARKPNVWLNLPEDARLAMNVTLAAATGEVVLGVSMLVNEMPTAMAMAHQGGAALVLGSSLWALHTLRFARPGGVLGAVAAAAKAV